MYKLAIVDELGTVMLYCDNVSNKRIHEWLTNHPDHRIECVYIN